jgi:hypothetical protein
MKRRVRTFFALLTVMAVGMVTIGSSVPVDADATKTLANWQMNESSSATVMTDSSGHGINGTIGSAVVRGKTEGGVTFYQWGYVRPNDPPPKPERLVQVNNSQLNPGTRDYAITVRFRTTRNFGNMIQKGQSHTSGGYFKWQIPSGKLSCLFRGRTSSGATVQGGVNSGSKLLNDGVWHTVRCERTASQVRMTVDGVVTGTKSGPTGSISNTVPLTIGGKLQCDQVEVSCDYFQGDIDYVKIETS